MKKLIALVAVIGFITIKSAQAQTAAKETGMKPATEVKAESTDSKADAKSCHGKESKASCCKKGSKAEAHAGKTKASCCAKGHGEEKAEMKEEKAERTKN